VAVCVGVGGTTVGVTVGSFDAEQAQSPARSGMRRRARRRRVIISNLLAIFQPSHYTRLARGVAQLAAHRVWDAGAGGSSPPTPTETTVDLLKVGGFPIKGISPSPTPTKEPPILE
jgi:hypothetical protein